MSDLQRKLFQTHLPPLPQSNEYEDGIVTHRNLRESTRNPVSSDKYFRDKYKIETTSATLQVYSSLPKSIPNVIFVCHHGAGSSAGSFAVLAGELESVELGIIAYDARGHGESTSTKSLDLSLETLASDLVELVEKISIKQNWEKIPNLVLVGHREALLGGAVVTHVAKSDKLPTVLAIAVLDVVEGPAIDSLAKMSAYLAKRPSQFGSLELAIQWHIKSRTLRNPDSAQVSVPPLLYQEGKNWKWKTNLAQTEPFWEGTLLIMFLSVTCGKLLVLAGTDRLDKTLLIGQMQGKFQLSIFPESGHFVHEDEPSQLAQLLIQLSHNYSGLSLPKQI